jgi:hypothetical protein
LSSETQKDTPAFKAGSVRAAVTVAFRAPKDIRSDLHFGAQLPQTLPRRLPQRGPFIRLNESAVSPIVLSASCCGGVRGPDEGGRARGVSIGPAKTPITRLPLGVGLEGKAVR